MQAPAQLPSCLRIKMREDQPVRLRRQCILPPVLPRCSFRRHSFRRRSLPRLRPQGHSRHCPRSLTRYCSLPRKCLARLFSKRQNQHLSLSHRRHRFRLSFLFLPLAQCRPVKIQLHTERSTYAKEERCDHTKFWYNLKTRNVDNLKTKVGVRQSLLK